MRTSILFVAFVAGLSLKAQTEVMQSSYSFSDGNHPTVVVAFDDVEASAVESWYKDQLKDVSKDVSSKKELRAPGARVPQVASDTITVLCKAEQPKKSKRVQLHLAYLVQGAWVSNTSDEKLVKAAKEHAYMLAVRYKKEVMTKKVEEEKKNLSKLQGEMADLQKEQARAEDGINKNRQKGVDAGAAKLQAEADLKANETAVAAKHASMGSAPNEDDVKTLQGMVKDGDKLKEKITKEAKNTEEANAKVKELEQQVKDLIDKQAAKKQAVDAQQEKLDAAMKALEEIK